MRTLLPGLLFLLGLLAPTASHAQALITAPANNGFGGVFLNLQPLDAQLKVTSLDIPFAVSNPTTVAVEVWTRSGSYVGFTDSSAGWTLTQTLGGLTAGIDEAVPFELARAITLPPTETTAVYLHSITSTAGMRYTGRPEVPPQTMWSNDDLVLLSDVARTGMAAFAGVLNSPRTFSGAIRYVKALETAPSNNGNGGIFLNLQAVGPLLAWKGFEVPLGAAVGTAVSVQVWTRTGSYAGFTDSPAGWTLTQTVQGIAQGASVPASFMLTQPIALSSSRVTGVYLQAVLPAASSSGIRYSGTSGTPPQTIWANSDIILFSDTARTGFTPFVGATNSPRTFSGSIYYGPDSLFVNGFDG